MAGSFSVIPGYGDTVIPVLLGFRQEAILGFTALSKQTYVKRRKREHTLPSYCEKKERTNKGVKYGWA